MPTAYKVGAPIKPRLSEHYRSALQVSEQIVARRIIKGLRRTETTGHGAKGRVRLASGTFAVETIAGKVYVNGATTTVESRTASVSETVCAAVKRGLFSTQDSPTQDDDATPLDFEDPYDANESAQTDPSDSEPESSSSDSEGEEGEEGEGEPGDSEDSDGDSEELDPELAEVLEDLASDPDVDPPVDPDELLRLIRRLNEIAEYLDDDAAEHSDHVSNRPFIDGAKMLAAGIPVEGILHAYALNWPDTARQAAGIEDYDPREFGHVDGKHELYAYVRAIIEADVPALMVGPTQAGKSYVVEEVAADLELEFRACPLTGGASSSWLLGAWTPEGFVEAGFPQIYGNGGVFLFDEIDAADPNMIVVLNNALSNGHLENPRNGEVIVKHSATRIAGAANTMLTGATAEYTGRARQDGAVAERFRMGRVLVDYDRPLQRALCVKQFAKAVRPSDD